MKPGPEQERLSAYLDDALPAAERVEFERLLASRPDLQTLADEWRQLRAAFRTLPSRKLPPAFNERVLATAEQRMLRAPKVVAVRPDTRMRSFAWAGLAVAVAAVLLVILSIPPKQRRLAQEKLPSDRPLVAPTAEAIRQKGDSKAETALTQIAGGRRVDEVRSSEIDADQVPTMAGYAAMNGVEAGTPSRFDFAVVISPQNLTQSGRLRKILPGPIEDTGLAMRDRSSTFRQNRRWGEGQGELQETLGRQAAATATPSAAAQVGNPVDLYVASGSAAAIQSLLQQLQSAGIPATQQIQFDLLQLPSAAGTAAVPARGAGRDDFMANAAREVPAAGHLQDASRPTEERLEEASRGIQLQYLGQVAVPAAAMGHGERDGEVATLSDADSAGRSQQVLIVIQNPAPDQ